jgi:hypothetical protein
MNENNIGRFGLACRLVQKDPDNAAKLFAALKFVPVRAEIVDFGGQIDYVGLSDRFRELTENEVAPYYIINFAISDTGVEITEVKEKIRC